MTVDEKLHALIYPYAGLDSFAFWYQESAHYVTQYHCEPLKAKACTLINDKGILIVTVQIKFRTLKWPICAARNNSQAPS